MEKGNYEEKIDFENVADFFDFFAPWSRNRNINGYIFRGHSKETYKLVPSALREENKDYIQKLSMNSLDEIQTFDSSKQIFKEKKILSIFYKTANENGLTLPLTNEIGARLHMQTDHIRLLSVLIGSYDDNALWPSSDYLELLSLAQHYGIPTRLLDWTYDPFVAIFFAVRSAIKKEGRLEIWCCNKAVLSNFSDVGIDIGINFHTPHYAHNLNIRAQRGLFSYFPVRMPPIYIDNMKNFNGDIDRRPAPDILSEKIDREKYGNIFKKVTLPCALATDAYHILFSMGYSAAKIFPGYDGVTAQMKDNANLFK
ncbi:FRG domain-containing protein [Serratia plymuthica]|uniref:FRG domain-containing protein n=1 Tax=Serratia plymuthica TaxID=82996 RepID=UPI000561F1FF|nr:FRG domain-containing protein [Serratia plymuthica]